MEWHLVHTIAAAFFGMLGFFMDYQSLMNGVRARRRGGKSVVVMLWPPLCYVSGALISDLSASDKGILIAIGVAFHLLSTVGMRTLPKA